MQPVCSIYTLLYSQEMAGNLKPMPSHWSQKVHMLFGWNVQSVYTAPHQKPGNPVGRVLHIRYSSHPRWLLRVVLRLPESWDSKVQPFSPKELRTKNDRAGESQEQFTRPTWLTSWLLTLQQWLCLSDVKGLAVVQTRILYVFTIFLMNATTLPTSPPPIRSHQLYLVKSTNHKIKMWTTAWNYMQWKLASTYSTLPKLDRHLLQRQSKIELEKKQSQPHYISANQCDKWFSQTQ